MRPASLVRPVKSQEELGLHVNPKADPSLFRVNSRFLIVAHFKSTPDQTLKISSPGPTSRQIGTRKRPHTSCGKARMRSSNPLFH